MKFFFHPSPNPMKVALLLEELQTPYELIGVDTFKGEQHLPAFLAINPNAKVPALVDGDATVFDSQAILLHLAQKYQRFLPTSVAGQAELLSWLMFIATGLSPFSGQAVHFLHHAPEDLAYAKNRYLKEVERHYRVLDQRLADHQYLAGDTYSIADAAFTPYVVRLDHLDVLGLLEPTPRVADWYRRIKARPSFQDGITRWENPGYLELMKRQGGENWPKIKEIMSAY